MNHHRSSFVAERASFLRVAASVLAAAVMLACVSSSEIGTDDADGSSSGGSSGTGGSPSLGGAGGSGVPGLGGAGASPGECLLPSDTEVLAKLAQATCAPVKGCCETAGMTFDVAACEQLIVGEYRAEFDAARCKGLQYDETGIADCVAALEAHGKLCGADDVDRATALTWAGACGRIFKGPENPGASCISKLECMAGSGKLSYCDTFDSKLNEPGKCGLTTLLPDGAKADCGGSSLTEAFVCESGYCTGDKCEPITKVQLGESCGFSAQCGPGNYCDDICRPKLDVGEACDYASHCKSGLDCSSAGVCGGAVGSACTQPDSGIALDCALGPCVGGKCGYRPRLMPNVGYGWSTYAAIACAP